ncbi:MAG: hypothetical protein A2X36_04405 [Elusimicrobia bacterium GWA2_69_24]|nr:MAG: hypothetical protein A2X36_04405 [Elusimicrobia bacterium GWA2_69_24]
MKLFTRYLGAHFLGPFFFGLGVFALLVFLGDLFDKMNRLATSPASLGVIFQYLVLQMPYWTLRIVPVATLLAALFTVSGFVRSGEYTAVQAAGFEVGPFFRPLLWMAAGVALVFFVAQETVLPACFSRSQTLWREKIHPVWEWDKFSDVVLAPGPDRFVSARLFAVKDGTFERPVMDYYNRRILRRQVDATEARWDKARGRWVFLEGVVRRYSEDGALTSSKPFVELVSDLFTPPKALVPRRKSPDEMSIFETILEIRHLEGVRRITRIEWTALHQKIAYPFTNVILCALGIPIALRFRQRSRSVAFTMALVVSALFLWFIEVGRMLGNSGSMPPLAAAWLPNGVFGALAFWGWRDLR